MSIVRTRRRYRYAEVVFPDLTCDSATARDVSEISACHGNEFENSCQTSCQLRYIRAALVVLQYLRYSQKRKPACWCC